MFAYVRLDEAGKEEISDLRFDSVDAALDAMADQSALDMPLSYTYMLIETST